MAKKNHSNGSDDCYFFTFHNPKEPNPENAKKEMIDNEEDLQSVTIDSTLKGSMTKSGGSTTTSNTNNG